MLWRGIPPQMSGVLLKGVCEFLWQGYDKPARDIYRRYPLVSCDPHPGVVYHRR
jgi:hypothetical protein